MSLVRELARLLLTVVVFATLMPLLLLARLMLMMVVKLFEVWK